MIIQTWQHGDIVHELCFEKPHLIIDIYRKTGDEALDLLVYELSPEAMALLSVALQLPEDPPDGVS